MKVLSLRLRAAMAESVLTTNPEWMAQIEREQEVLRFLKRWRPCSLWVSPPYVGFEA